MKYGDTWTPLGPVCGGTRVYMLAVSYQSMKKLKSLKA